MEQMKAEAKQGQRRPSLPRAGVASIVANDYKARVSRHAELCPTDSASAQATVSGGSGGLGGPGGSSSLEDQLFGLSRGVAAVNAPRSLPAPSAHVATFASTTARRRGSRGAENAPPRVSHGGGYDGGENLGGAGEQSRRLQNKLELSMRMMSKNGADVKGQMSKEGAKGKGRRPGSAARTAPRRRAARAAPSPPGTAPRVNFLNASIDSNAGGAGIGGAANQSVNLSACLWSKDDSREILAPANTHDRCVF